MSDKKETFPVLVYSSLISLLIMVYAKLDKQVCSYSFDEFISRMIERDTTTCRYALPFKVDFERSSNTFNYLEQKKWLDAKRSSFLDSFNVSRDKLSTISVSRESLIRIEDACRIGYDVLGMPLILNNDKGYRTAPVVAGLLIGAIIHHTSDVEASIYGCNINNKYGYFEIAPSGASNDLIIYPSHLKSNGEMEFKILKDYDYFQALTNSFENC
jgi:hypothetical protein